MTSPLERRYRRWAGAYPPGPRRQELIDTLLECAPPGRARPAPREVVNLLRHGLRARLGRPGGRAVVVLATLVALIGGLAGAAVAARVGWQWVPALPGGAQADALKRTVFPGMTAYGGGDAPLIVDSSDGENIRFGFADYWVEHTAATRDLDVFTAAARDRLLAAGWRLHGDVTATDSEPDAITPTRSTAFLASHDGLVLAFRNTVWSNRAAWDNDGAASFTLTRAAPAWLWALTVAGGLLGALGGWLLVGWASRRTAPRSAMAFAAGTLAWPVVLLVPLVVLILAMWSIQPDRPWSETLFVTLFRLVGPAGYAGIAALPSLAIAALSGPRLSGRTTAATLAVVLAGAAGVLWSHRGPASPPGPAECRPSGVPAELPADQTRLAMTVHVFIRQDTTPDQRNIVQAAIARVWGTSAFNFYYDPTAPEYGDAYCAGGRLADGAGVSLPYFWQVDISSPGVFSGLEAEVAGLPGVLGVRRGPATVS
ncbi:hypothetical protein [Actinoplanes auranticolor]|uniref:hypothetical protein n=1 Tax=Actinoplanes auranticolor TaxID=47988 RepID=UPI001BB44878|nr:hypothetical protein [Actinoplanes auranticolor]